MKLFLSSLLLLAGLALFGDATASLLLAQVPDPIDIRCETLAPSDYKKADPNMEGCTGPTQQNYYLCSAHQTQLLCQNVNWTGYEMAPLFPQGCVTSTTKSLCDKPPSNCWRICACEWIQDPELEDYCQCQDNNNNTWHQQNRPKTVTCP